MLDWRHVIQHKDTQHKDTQHNDTQHNNTQHYDSQHNDIQSVFLLNVVILWVVRATSLEYALALLANIRLGWKGLQGTNQGTLTEEEGLVRLTSLY
jgi:hypothetical protein